MILQFEEKLIFFFKGPPNQPQNLVASDVGTTSFTVRWDPPTDEGVVPVDTYIVSFSVNNSETASAAIGNLPIVTFTEQIPDAVYEICVTAANMHGSSLPSSTLIVTTKCFTGKFYTFLEPPPEMFFFLCKLPHGVSCLT